MSVEMRNRYLQILHKNQVSRANIKKIMKDIDESEIFREEKTDEDFEDLEEIADIYADETIPLQEKKEKLREFKEHSGDIRTERQKWNEEKVESKKKYYMDLGQKWGNKEEENTNTGNRFGRSPLHEAIAFRNIEFVKKCITEKMYLDALDNNGNTPMEMAYYEGWFEVVKLFNQK